MQAHPLAWIQEFLAEKRIAVAGVSRNPKHFSRLLFDEFVKRGYEMVPVNPNAEEIAGLRCYPAAGAIEPAVRAVLVMTPADKTLQVVSDAIDAGAELVWLYRSVGGGSVTRDAVEACDNRGVRVIAGECPFMHFPKPGWIHSLHRGWRALTGTLPR